MVAEHIVRIVDRLPRFEIQHKNITLRIHRCLEGDLGGDRAPGDRHDLIDARNAVVDDLAGVDIDHRDRVGRAAFDGEGDLLAVGTPGHAGSQNAQALELGAGLPIDQLFLDLPIDSVGDVDIKQSVARGDKRQPVAQGREGWAGVVETSIVGGDDRPREIVHVLAGGQFREIDLLEGAAPAVGQFIEREAGGAFKAGFDGLGEAEALEDFGDALAPVLLANIIPHPLAGLVGGKAADIGYGRDGIVDDGVAQPVVGIGAPPLGGILGQPLVEPVGDLEPDVILDDGLQGAAVEVIVQHRVDQLVVERLAKLTVIAHEGDRDAVFIGLRDAGDAFGKRGEIDRVRHHEVVVALVDDDGDAAA